MTSEILLAASVVRILNLLFFNSTWLPLRKDNVEKCEKCESWFQFLVIFYLIFTQIDVHIKISYDVVFVLSKENVFFQQNESRR